ncbi:MAG: hypothetical protein N3E48_03105, partial [Candidatus Bathyarchaeota archaeon]|nr:hypothetical protein [Candidatus Bathyarchaeota archaeon]
YGGWGIAGIRAMNEGKIPDTISVFYIDEPGVFIQRYCDILMDVNYEECKRLNVPIARGIAAGGGVIYAEPGIEPFIGLTWNPKRNPQIPTNPELFFMRMLGRAADVISEKYKIPLRYRPLNDMEVWDPNLKSWRKVMGTGTTTVGECAAFAWFPTFFKPSELMGRVLVSPKDKFSDKVFKEVSLRSWNFEEAGAFRERPSRDDVVKDWIDITLKVVKDVFNIEVEHGEFTEEEVMYAEEFYKIFSSEENLFSRSAEKRFSSFPEGTSLGKYSVKVTGGPLIRAYVLRKGDNIEDIMFTGTMHMYPADALEELEKELKGCKIDETLIKNKVNELFVRKNVIIGMGSAELVAETVIKACKESYKQ